MTHLDGFTLIDYIKSSVEILMNMKSDDDDNGFGDDMEIRVQDQDGMPMASIDDDLHIMLHH